MNTEELLLCAVRQAISTLPDYEEGGLDDDQSCDVAWVKSRLADALTVVEADLQHREAA